MDITGFLPSADLLIDETTWSPTTGAATLMVSLATTTAACPRCQTRSARIHSRYTRTLADLPWAQYRITLLLHVRRFRCLATPCLQQIFAERLPGIVAPFARRTHRLHVRQQQFGLLLGGVLGATASQASLGPISRTTLLRLVQRAPDPPAPPPTVIGIDDWAFRKRETYGTIVVDLERGTVLDLLPDRTSETVAAWLAAHPTVKTVSRDRAQAYADAIRQGAPAAVQVADRWHLVRNVVTALDSVLVQQRAAWESALTSQLQEAPACPASDPIPPPPSTPPEAPPGCPHRRAHREARYANVRTLAAAGQSIRSIATATGLSRNTVRRYVRADGDLICALRPRRPSVLDPYKPYIQDRWTTTTLTVETLLNDIRAQGYPGKRSILRAFVATLRQSAPTPPPPILPRPREIIGWICQRVEARSTTATIWLDRVHRAHPGVAQALLLTETFLTMVRERQRERFGGWLDAATESGLKPFQAVARSMQQDAAAVGAGLELPWSTGPVEGHINRLKYLKRQMFGRASLALLRKRVQYRPEVGGSDHQQRA